MSNVDLSEFDNEYAKAEAPGDDFDALPDGKYDVVVDRVELRYSKTGKPMLTWQLKVAGPTHVGRMVWKNSVIVAGKPLAFLKRDLKTCGLEIGRLSDLQHNLEKLLDVRLTATIKAGRDGQNVYLGKPPGIEIEPANEPTSEPARASGGKRDFDDIPF